MATNLACCNFLSSCICNNVLDHYSLHFEATAKVQDTDIGGALGFGVLLTVIRAAQAMHVLSTLGPQ